MICKRISHLKTVLSSPGYSRYSPGKRPRDSTEESVSSSSLSGVLRIRPEEGEAVGEEGGGNSDCNP